ncbi:MAG: hypothetical protein WHV44_06065 [Anaerolineales bacterium]
MNVCVLSDEIYADFDPGPYLKGHRWKLFNVKKPALSFIRELTSRYKFDVFLNMCDGGPDEDRPGIDVVQALEALDLPFTGADSQFYDPTRDQMRDAALRRGVNFARGVHIAAMTGLFQKVESLRYPLIVKHPQSYASVGLTPLSRVTTPEQLVVQVQRMLSEFGAARVEEFIEGREFAVLVSDNPDDLGSPLVYTPVEFVFPPGESFKHAELKWHDFAQMECVPVTDTALTFNLQHACRELYLGLGGVGYGRCDVRMDADGRLYILEINPNCALFYPPETPGSADYILMNTPGGHKAFVDRIFRAARLRQKARQQARAGALIPTPAGW